MYTIYTWETCILHVVTHYILYITPKILHVYHISHRKFKPFKHKSYENMLQKEIHFEEGWGYILAQEADE